MKKIAQKPAPQENIEKYAKFGTGDNSKELSKQGYISFLNSATSELRNEYLKLSAKEALKMGKTLEQVGLELIKRVVIDKKNLEISEIDVKNEDVKSAKLDMLRVIDSIKHLCLGQKQKETVINIAPIEKNVTERTPIVEIAKPTFEEIETQEAAIMAIVHEYEFEVGNVLEVMKGRYDEEKDSRMKGLLKDELFTVQEDFLSRIKKDIDNIPESEYLQIAGAKADLIAVKSKIQKMTEGIESEEEQRMAV